VTARARYARPTRRAAARAVVALCAIAAASCSKEPAKPAEVSPPAAAPAPERRETEAHSSPVADEAPEAEIARLVDGFSRGQSALSYNRSRARLAELVPGREAALRVAYASYDARARAGDSAASDVLDNVCDVLQMTGDASVARLALAFFDQPHPKLRLKAVQTVAGLFPSGAAEALADRAADPAESLPVRFAALEGLGTKGDSSVAPRLRPLLADESSPDLLARAVAALGLLGDAASADRFAALATTVDSPVSLEAMRALVRVGDPRGLEKIEPLASNPDAHVRLTAATLLSTVPTAPASRRLLAMAADKEAAVRQAVMTGLGAAPPEVDVDSTFRAMAKDSDIGVRRGALFFAAKRGSAWALEALRASAADRASPDRLASMVSLGRCRDRESIEPLLKVAGDEAEAPQARLTASNNLARIGDASVLPRLLRFVAKATGALPTGEDLRSTMTVGLANFGPDSIPHLADFLRQATTADEKRVAITVLRFIGGAGAEAARRALESLLATETDAALRREIEDALSK